MIDEYGSHIHEIYVSLDSHYPKHIAHAICWKHKDFYIYGESGAGDVEGKPYNKRFHPKPFTEISHQDVLDGMIPNNYNVYKFYHFYS